MNTFPRLTAAVLTTIAIAIAIAITLTPVGSSAPAAAETVETVEMEKTEEAPAQLTLVNATAEQAAMVDDAIALFDTAGLALAPLQIEFHESEDSCNGYAGYYLPAQADPDANVDRITICTRLKVILLHELAHAWKHHNLDDQTRAAFTEHWGLNSWRDSSDAHDDRGIERAAHTIAFTLNQTEATDNEGILRYICGYELLTGSTLEIHTKVEC